MDADLGPEPLRVLSQTTVVRNGPTYLKLSTVRPSVPPSTRQDPPTVKTAFPPRDVIQIEQATSISSDGRVPSVVSSPSRIQPSSLNASSGFHSPITRRQSQEPAERQRQPQVSPNHNRATMTPNSTRGLRPRLSGASQKPVSSKSESISTQKPGSSSANNSTFQVYYKTQKVRETDIEMSWYWSIRDPGISRPPKDEDLSDGVKDGYLYLHHTSKENLQDPTIWLCEADDDSKRWVRIKKGHAYRYGQGDDRRYLSISAKGKPSWNKKSVRSPAEVYPDRDDAETTE